ncbi:MAG: prepilin peptidase [Deltaproteobacteria bacterium]|nr:MAG: prepilin peptidase [Deltaproteobacteria bacterium]
MPELFMYSIVIIFGAIVGSFLNVVILRLPRQDASIVFPGSHCPHCNHSLSWYENIPVLSYAFLMGKCRSCKTHISLQYPIVEILTAILALFTFYRFGLSVTSAGYFLFCAGLVAIIWIDAHHQIIPDLISLPGIIIGFLFSLVNQAVSWQDSLIGLLAGGGVLYAIAVVYALVRKQDGMGGGDIKLLAMLGAFLGWQSLPFIILVSSFTGSIAGIFAMVRQKQGAMTKIPFGPFLAGAGLVYLFFMGDIYRFYQWYLHLSMNP